MINQPSAGSRMEGFVDRRFLKQPEVPGNPVFSGIFQE
jgi:hypothetical protein